jgi:hypothetical protein
MSPPKARGRSKGACLIRVEPDAAYRRSFDAQSGLPRFLSMGYARGVRFLFLALVAR